MVGEHGWGHRRSNCRGVTGCVIHTVEGAGFRLVTYSQPGTLNRMGGMARDMGGAIFYQRQLRRYLTLLKLWPYPNGRA